MMITEDQGRPSVATAY